MCANVVAHPDTMVIKLVAAAIARRTVLGILHHVRLADVAEIDSVLVNRPSGCKGGSFVLLLMEIDKAVESNGRVGRVRRCHNVGVEDHAAV